MPKTSAGILPYRRRSGQLEVLLVHPGGPFWVNKDLGSWSIAKGEYEEGEEPLQAALREFFEETGHKPTGPFLPLTRRKLASGKLVDAWATESDWDTSHLVSNTFSIEWPKGSGVREFPEVDRAEWFEISEAIRRIRPAQVGFIDELVEKLMC
ncbi:NUDIX domain-containing protein [Nitrosovibrio sp. Nv6]|uniref:NUDIX domain-containing protein n=1 Tax=Nitrosovibrio sp. Nv6 TaxID=1855340 RepID=UPI0008AFC31E|nr:NUDIX domain-containing protein [Nitrosovibrio sp. Nv6]SEP11549.1 Predicted NTP pyrophosphohydrolase, NUDIX family [Nitrosovibrio sp. Nv6]